MTTPERWAIPGGPLPEVDPSCYPPDAVELPTADPQEQHREALARLNGLLEDEFLIIAYEPFLRGCRDILLRHAPVECVDVVPESHWCAGCAVRWPCPDWRDAAGTEAADV